MRLIEKLNAALESPLPGKLKHYCEWQMMIILLFILFGDSFKWGGLVGITEYNWIQGHFADIGLTAQFTTAMYYLFGHKKKSIPFVLLLPPAAFTFYELMQFPRTDSADIACYFAGSAIALCSVSLYGYMLSRAYKNG
jgi:hypothetical protein